MIWHMPILFQSITFITLLTLTLLYTPTKCSLTMSLKSIFELDNSVLICDIVLLFIPLKIVSIIILYYTNKNILYKYSIK